ncbi:hypothetical protein [Anaeromyxobacter terrae]|uniref:hypothetical protein n=1 Tax=Anaeromyxobacter terrae TaxID=2925406 RepID=UPI001F572C92|nr:hypothetical protein [Anaeromyxobacter sp. SG22]
MRDPRLAPFRLPALAFAAFLLVQAGSAAALFALKLGGSPAGVSAFYLGDVERFTAPKSLPGLLEVAVPHLAAIPIVLFAVAHVVIFARALPARVARGLATLSFGAALAGIAVSFGVRYLGPALAPVKVAAFGLLEVTLLAWAALLAAVFLPARAEATARARPEAAVGAVRSDGRVAGRVHRKERGRRAEEVAK